MPARVLAGARARPASYLGPRHPEIEEFLQRREGTEDESRRTHKLHLANWVPDEFVPVQVSGLKLVALTLQNAKTIIAVSGDLLPLHRARTESGRRSWP